MHKALEVFIDFLYSLEQNDVQIKKIIEQFGFQFLLFYCKGFSHRLLRTPLQKREKLTVLDFVEQTKKLAAKLGIQDQYKPEHVLSIKLAEIIDRKTILRNLFLFFKMIYAKPISK